MALPWWLPSLLGVGVLNKPTVGGGLGGSDAQLMESLRRFCLKGPLSDKVADSLLKSSGLKQNAPGASWPPLPVVVVALRFFLEGA